MSWHVTRGRDSGAAGIICLFSEDFMIQPRSSPLSNTAPVFPRANNAGPVSNDGGLPIISSRRRRDT